MNEQDIRKIVQDEISRSSQKAMYSVTNVPIHSHNGSDSPNVPATNVTGFLPLSAIDGGVLDPRILGVLTAETLTGTVAQGATSATLSSGWSGTTGTYVVYFSNGDKRNVLFTNSSTSITWSPGLGSAATADIEVVTNSKVAFWEQVTLDGGQSNTGNRALIPVFPIPIISGDIGESLPFDGGEAPDGTMIIYKGPDFYQLFVMIFGTWRGVSLPYQSDEIPVSGTFTAQSGETVTVTQGIITDIT